MVKRELKRVVEFLPSDKRLSILNQLLNVYNKKELSKLLGCNTALIQKWKREKYIDDSICAKLLQLAFYRIPETQSILSELLVELDNLLKELRIKETNNKLAIFMNELDEKSKQIIWYLLRNGYANIRELAEVINARIDNEVLIRVREIINPKAKEIFGKELMKFENQKISPNGEKILFSWWLTENVLPGEKSVELLDIFEEDSQIKIIAKTPRAREENLRIKLKDNTVTILTDRYHKTIPLLYPVKRILEKTYRNGILELKLEKSQ